MQYKAMQASGQIPASVVPDTPQTAINNGESTLLFHPHMYAPVSKNVGVPMGHYFLRHYFRVDCRLGSYC